MNTCLICDSTKDREHWTVTEGDICGDADGECMEPYTCDSSGECVANYSPEGTRCGTYIGYIGECSTPNFCDGKGNCIRIIVEPIVPEPRECEYYCYDYDCGDYVIRYKPHGSPCGLGPTSCSGQSFCNGSGRCQPNPYPNGTQCGEGDSACSWYECFAGACGTELVYRTCKDDGIACTVDSCDPDTGRCNTPDDAYCDDRVQCTTDSCNPDIEGDGCEHIPNHTACDDNNPCTVDSCTSNGCENLDNGMCDDAGFGSGA